MPCGPVLGLASVTTIVHCLALGTRLQLLIDRTAAHAAKAVHSGPCQVRKAHNNRSPLLVRVRARRFGSDIHCRPRYTRPRVAACPRPRTPLCYAALSCRDARITLSANI
eukprot:6213944-Pleurochrysis_carterae.AAC.1